MSDMLGSSTPDGLAPLSTAALVILGCTLAAFPLAWAAYSLALLLLRPISLDKEQPIFDALCRNVTRASANFLLFNFAVSLVAGVIFFVIIWVLNLGMRVRSITLEM